MKNNRFNLFPSLENNIKNSRRISDLSSNTTKNNNDMIYLNFYYFNLSETEKE